jgi:hypothetical protein
MAFPGTVLFVGFDPRTVPDVDAELVETAIAMGQARFDAEEIDVDSCFVAPNEHAIPTIAERLEEGDYACIVVGRGLRKPDDTVALLEQVIDVIRRLAPQTPIAFNTNPFDSIDAVRRCVPMSRRRASDL